MVGNEDPFFTVIHPASKHFRVWSPTAEEAELDKVADELRGLHVVPGEAVVARRVAWDAVC